MTGTSAGGAVGAGPQAGSRSTIRVGIVGAGFGGLAAAIELRRAGVGDITLLERGDAVGGVWRANAYPGAACDVPSEIYSFSYALKPDWSRRFGTRAEIQQYLVDVARHHGLDDALRFDAEVTAMRWDDEALAWDVELRGEETLRFDVVICATGQLSRPKVPDVPGRDSFAGRQFHSAEWEQDVDLAGRRVAVVGSGASAVQLVPAIADRTEQVTVVQRSPNWIVPKYDWRTSWLERALNRVPGVAKLRHLAMWWWFEKNFPIVLRSAAPSRKLFEAKARWVIRRHLPDPTEADAVTPTYPMGCNRILLSSDWYPTLARPDVELVAEGVASVTEGGLVTTSGKRIDADVIVWCTGFTPTEYLAPIEIVGRDGRDIRDAWDRGPEAYLGISTHGFPNLFMSYGPNTGSLTNTIIFMLERQADYIRQAIEHVDAAGGAIDVREDTHRAYNDMLTRRLAKTVFTAGCPGWYTTDEGRVTTVFPGSHVEYALRTRRFRPEDFEALRVGRRVDSATEAVA